MADIDTIESINREQLATASDRLLLRGRVSRQRARGWGAPRGTSPAIPHGPLAEGSQPRIVLPVRRAQHPVPPARASQALVIVPLGTAPPRGPVPLVSAVALTLSPLVGFAVGLAATL
jgi:hypothetical protein